MDGIKSHHLHGGFTKAIPCVPVSAKKLKGPGTNIELEEVKAACLHCRRSSAKCRGTYECMAHEYRRQQAAQKKTD